MRRHLCNVMRRKIMQRDVERLKLKPWIESVRSWINVGVEATILEQAERYATNQKLKIWENYVKGQELSNGSTALETKQKKRPLLLSQMYLAVVDSMFSRLETRN
ncbi:hypothetical protein Bca4012_073991 [Brassica carinata]